MKTIKIRGIKSESTIKELVRALELCREVKTIVETHTPEKRDECRGCVDYYDEMLEADKEIGGLVINLSSAIGFLAAYDISGVVLNKAKN